MDFQIAFLNENVGPSKTGLCGSDTTSYYRVGSTGVVATG